ncbi:hypothetical protein BT93_L2507 [Corymbia citriodora subsp. variegata]|uniref:Uncharacterized protein n=1 Tax=Corymbia citriodora subsp. variegata TaxID=360336 RepID=A0A8T0CJP2_CORYI|nr:hypothetical protein BT93_L2507 [Corymbia citriodora subsp. variegata]
MGRVGYGLGLFLLLSGRRTTQTEKNEGDACSVSFSARPTPPLRLRLAESLVGHLPLARPTPPPPQKPCRSQLGPEPLRLRLCLLTVSIAVCAHVDFSSQTKGREANPPPFPRCSPAVADEAHDGCPCSSARWLLSVLVAAPPFVWRLFPRRPQRSTLRP